MLKYLALGDSYTIGEFVTLEKTFPYQLQKKLNENGISTKNPLIVAITGWTTDELLNGINNTDIHPPYDIVTLLIGVNNQYRGRSVENFAIELDELVVKAINFAGENHKRLFVLSIPDWGKTPFANGRNKEKISEEIDQYNMACKSICEKYKVDFIDITDSTRQNASNPDFLVSDGLHPSHLEYEIWVERLMPKIIEQLRSAS